VGLLELLPDSVTGDLSIGHGLSSNDISTNAVCASSFAAKDESLQNKSPRPTLRRV
jgi:hypothetical protein